MKLPLPSFQLVGIVAAIAFALGATGAWRVTSWKAAADQSAAVRAAAKAERIAQQNVITTLQEQITAANAASQGYQDEIAKLHADRSNQPVPDVRVCRAPRSAPGNLPRTGETPRGSDEAATPAGQLPPTAGPNIGPELYSVADDADDVAAQLRALQDWIRRLD